MLVWVNDKWYARDAEKQSMAIDSQQHIAFSGRRIVRVLPLPDGLFREYGAHDRGLPHLQYIGFHDTAAHGDVCRLVQTSTMVAALSSRPPHLGCAFGGLVA